MADISIGEILGVLQVTLLIIIVGIMQKDKWIEFGGWVGSAIGAVMFAVKVLVG